MSLLTVATYDTPDKVKAFLTTHHYTLPVAMAGDSIISNYEIPGYPAKVLISPDGRWLPIRFGTDWQEVVKKHIALYQQYTQLDKQPQQLQARKLN